MDEFTKEQVKREWYMHINNEKIYSINLCRYLTIEIWLQQVYNNKFINGCPSVRTKKEYPDCVTIRRNILKQTDVGGNWPSNGFRPLLKIIIK